MTTARATVVATKTAVHQLGSQFYFVPDTTALGEALGLDTLQLYVAGRGGVLGDVSADVVDDVFHFFVPGMIPKGWNGAMAVTTPEKAAAAYAEGNRIWGRKNYTDLPGVERLAELTGKIVAANDLGARTPLYTGLRALGAADDAPAAAAEHISALRELRGDLHVLAIDLFRLQALDAAVADGESEGRIRMHGWQGDLPEVSAEVKARRAAAEDLTDDMVAAAFSMLDDAELAELDTLLNAAFRHVKDKIKAAAKK
jgi:roadblock/LC7 domain-containing protein